MHFRYGCKKRQDGKTVWAKRLRERVPGVGVWGRQKQRTAEKGRLANRFQGKGNAEIKRKRTA